MNFFTIRTESNGIVEITNNYSGRIGHRLYLHVDQTANINNGEGDAAILLNNAECKEIIGILNLYLKEQEGDDYVVLKSELLKQNVGMTASTI